MRVVFTMLFVVALCGVAHASDSFEWRDSASGTRFKFLPKPVWAGEADAACAAEGWDVFNYEYLTSEEQHHFLAAEELGRLPWQKHYAGQPSEHETLHLWMSSEAHGNRAVLALRQSPGDSKRHAALRWTSDKPLPVLCMYQSLPWVRCRVAVTCRDTGPQAAPFSRFWFVTEYGPTKRIAIQRAKDRFKLLPAEYPPCELGDTTYCETLRPVDN